MSAKELRVECPRCGSRLDVDLRTEQVLRARPPGSAAAAGPAKGSDLDWRAALERASGRGQQSAERFEQALKKEQRRSTDLDDLFARVSASGPAPRNAGVSVAADAAARSGSSADSRSEPPDTGEPTGEAWPWTLERARLASLTDSLSLAGVAWSSAGGWLTWQQRRELRWTQGSPELSQRDSPGHPAPSRSVESAAGPTPSGPDDTLMFLPGSGIATSRQLDQLARSGWRLASFESVFRSALSPVPAGTAVAAGTAEITGTADARPAAPTALKPVLPSELADWQRALLAAWRLAPAPDAPVPLGRWQPLWCEPAGLARQPVALWLEGPVAVLGALTEPLLGASLEPLLGALRSEAARAGCRWLLVGAGLAEGAEGGVLHLDPERCARLGFQVAYHRALFSARPLA